MRAGEEFLNVAKPVGSQTGGAPANQRRRGGLPLEVPRVRRESPGEMQCGWRDINAGTEDGLLQNTRHQH